jgi:hypothetical protein
MGGLADALAMQGRRGDSTLVHMNPMEVRMLETMSPDGRLSINPETGLPEAFKLKDVAAFALPIAASIAAPYLIPAAWGLGAVGAGAIGAGVGGFGAGLIQGKGLKDSLVQGGISGLMSYGMGSLMAPGTMTGGAEAIQGGVTSTPPLGADSMGLGGYSAAQEAAVTQGLGAAGIGAPDGSSLIAAGTPTSSFANIGLAPKGSVPYTAATDVYQPGTSETGLGQLFDRASRTSPFGQTNIYGDALGATQVPTYTQIGGSVLGSAGQMALEDMLSPEEMPYDIAGMDDMDAYYASRIPDLEAGRRRGRAAARSLNYPPSGSTGSQYYGMATSPGGFGTFYAADGGRVPTDLNINGEPHQLSYINQEEADLLRSMGGAGRDVMGVPAYFGGALSNLLPQIAEQAMQNPEAYGLSRGPATAADLSSGKTTGVNNARTVKDELLNLLSSDYYGMATSPGGFGTFYAADGGQVPGALGDLPPHVARGLMENPEIGTDAAAFSNLVNSQPSPKNLMGRLPGALGNLPPHVARGLMQNPEIGRDAATFSKLVNSQPSPKDLMGGRLPGAFGYLPPHVARGLIENPEIGTDAAAFRNLVTGKASGIQTDQTSNLDAGRLRGQAAARSLNYPLSGGSAADYYGMATSPGGFGTFYAADGGRVPTDLKINGEPHQLSYINQEEADLLRSMGGSGQNVYGIPAYYDASNDGGDAAGPAGGGVGDSNDGGDAAGPAGVSDMGLGGYSDAQAAISAPPPDIGMLGRGVTGLFGLSPKGFTVNPDLSYSQTMGIGVPGIGTAVANAMGIDTSLGTVTGPTTSPGGGDIGDDDGGVGDAGGDSGVYGRPYGDPYNTKKVQAPTAPAPSPVGPTALRFLSLTAPRTAGDIYNAATTGGIPRFFTGMAQGGGISSLAYGGEAAPVGFANKAFEGMVPGQGTGMSDDIPFSIEGNQPALLSRDEYVLPADVVSQLGDGSSSAGADMLDNFISQVRQTKYGNTQQPAPVGPQLMTGLMRQGGTV